MDALQQNSLHPSLTWAQHKDYWQNLQLLIHRASRGVVQISERPEAEAKVIRETILELRPALSVGDRPAFGKPARKLRLYYGEPAGQEHCLLGLHLDTKEASRAGLDEQDDAIEESLRRANDWWEAA